MQRAAGEHDGAAVRRAIAAAAEFRKRQVAAVIVVIEIDGDGEAAMLRAGIDIVAVAMEVAAQSGVVTGDDVAVHPRGGELKEPFDGRKKTAHDLAADSLAHVRMHDAQIVAALEPVIHHRRRLACAIEQKPGILAAELFVEIDEEIAKLKIEDAWHDEHRRIERHAGRIVDRRQALQHATDRLGMSGGVVPGNIGDRAQHGIEHDGARHLGGAEGAADGAVVIGDERDRRSVQRGVVRNLARRRGEHAVEHDPVFVKQLCFLQKCGQFFLHARVGGRTEERQHDPAAGCDLKIEGAFADERRAEPGHGIAKDDPRAVFACRHRESLRSTRFHRGFSW